MNPLALDAVGVADDGDTFSAEVGPGEDRTLPLPPAWVLVLLGVRRPKRGVVRIFGVDMHGPGHLARAELARVAAVADEVGLIGNLTVRDNVALPIRYHRKLADREVAERVDGLLQRHGLAEQARATIWSLDPEQRRSVALVRALASEPELLVLDPRGGPIEDALVAAVRVRGTIVRLGGRW